MKRNGNGNGNGHGNGKRNGNGPSYEQRRWRHIDTMQRHLGQLMRNLELTPEETRRLREGQLQDLVRFARANSPWWAHRLRKIDPDSITEERLGDIPPMTKADLMGNWDEIVTDRRLTLDGANSHVADLTEAAYWHDEYHVMVSGGASGVRALMVSGWDEWAICWASMMRWIARWGYRAGFIPKPALAVMSTPRNWTLKWAPLTRWLLRIAHKTGYFGLNSFASVAAATPIHVSVAMAHTFTSDIVPSHRFPIMQPLPRIVDGLNSLQPSVLLAYPSALRLLVTEQSAGRLRISPDLIVSGAEPLDHLTRERTAAAWPTTIIDAYGTTEAGCLAHECGYGERMHLSDDLCIVEPVDRDGCAVPPGETAPRVLVTSLYGRTMPLLRYEITDEVTLAAESRCDCGCSFRLVESVRGRSDEVFDYGDGVLIHSVVFSSPLRVPGNVVEYQVRQTHDGASVHIVRNGPVDTQALSHKLESYLSRAGLDAPRVTVETVDAIPRVGIGKVLRFVPLKRAPEPAV